MNPFISIMGVVSWLMLIFLIAHVRARMTARTTFDLPSYLLGIIFAAVTILGVFSFRGLIQWLT